MSSALHSTLDFVYNTGLLGHCKSHLLTYLLQWLIPYVGIWNNHTGLLW